MSTQGLHRLARAAMATLWLAACGLALADPPERGGERGRSGPHWQQSGGPREARPSQSQQQQPSRQNDRPTQGRQGYAGPPPSRGYAGPSPERGYAGPPPAQGYAGRPPARGYAGPTPLPNVRPGPAPGPSPAPQHWAPPPPPAPARWAPPPPRYPRHGVVVNVLPATPAVYWRNGVNFYFSSGIWYRPQGSSFMVIAPPIGLVVPLLPDVYETRIVGSTTYFYAGETYYRAVPEGYVVTKAPSTVVSTTTAAGSDKVFYYPRNGQSTAQQDEDRYQCYEWAVEQTGFDPTLPDGGIDGGGASQARADYGRALDACMDGRGYTMR
ncbi:MAG: DUF6515 family protein [Rhodocyclaceae bacterium]